VSIKAHGDQRTLEFYFWWERPAAGVAVPCRDRLAARTLLARLAARGDLPALRRLALVELPGGHLDDTELLDQLSAWMAAGKLRVMATPRWILFAQDGDEPEEQPAEIPFNEPPPEVPVALIPDAMPRIDQVAQAAALRRAATKGTPFCEECEKAKREREAKEAAAPMNHG
jgi:hypothetical protein